MDEETKQGNRYIFTRGWEADFYLFSVGVNFSRRERELVILCKWRKRVCARRVHLDVALPGPMGNVSFFPSIDREINKGLRSLE